jgi:hypothetical protein
MVIRAAALLMNCPLVISITVFAYQLVCVAPDWAWRLQFWTSFACTTCLCLLFFLGSAVVREENLEITRVDRRCYGYGDSP